MSILARRSLLVVAVLLLHAACANASGIWVLCDGCTSEADYAEVALTAPHEGSIFLSNRNTNTTYHYTRLVRQIGDSWQAQIAKRSMSPEQEQVFQSIIESARAVFVVYLEIRRISERGEFQVPAHW